MMKKLSKFLSIVVLAIALLGLLQLPANADPLLVEYLDVYENAPPTVTVTTPIFTDVIKKGVPYIVTVEGTVSIWPKTSWSAVCAGTVNPLPDFPTLDPSVVNGPVGIDAAYMFAFPKSSPSLCPGGNPKNTPPFRFRKFEVSTDSGVTWFAPEPTFPGNGAYNPAHIYQFMVTATSDNAKLAFHFKDSPLTDNYGMFKITVEKTNEPPVANAGGPYYGYEGSPVWFDGSGSSDPDGDALSYSWTFGDGTSGSGINPSHTYPDNAVFPVCLTVTDTVGNTNQACTTATILNVAPTITSIMGDPNPVKAGKPLATYATFTDPGTADTHTAVWDWGDGTTSTGDVTETNGSGSVATSHVYQTPGIYRIELKVTDDDGDWDTAEIKYQIVYDPETGFITGGGWIWNPDNACPQLCDSGKTKVNFGFVARYKRGADVPTGQTEFQFKSGDLNFHSSYYEWLVISKEKAFYKGVGTINGSGEYGFLLSAIDGQIIGKGTKDQFRMKIWDNSTGEVLYDTQMGADDYADPTTTLNGGNIVIHAK